MAKLHSNVTVQLGEAGVTKAQYLAHCGYDPGQRWGGDACGCPDDHCIGYHHRELEQCSCFESLLSEIEHEETTRDDFRATLALLGARELEWFMQELTRLLATTRGEGENYD